MAWLLLTHALAVAAWLWWIIFHEAPLNADMIAADGASDSLKAGFHARRLNVRASVAAPLAVVGSAPALLAGPAPYVYAVAGLLVLLGAVFIRTFNPLLSKARGLDPFYVSKAPEAALLPDRLLTRLGWGLKPFLTACLIAGILVYAAAMGAVIHLLP